MSLDSKLAVVDLTTGKIEIKTIPVKLRQQYVGGRGLDAYLLYNYVKPGCDAFSPDNAVVISGGLLAGMLASATSRYHVAGKSPLTNLFGSCNGGGFFTPELANAGFNHLLFVGKSPKPVYVFVHNGEIEIKDAKNIWGLNVHDTQKAIRDELNDREVKVLTIGVGGEKLVRFANVMTGIKNAGGRTGMGAVMGSKNLKAVAARGTMDLKIAFPQEALDYNKHFITQITSAKVNETQGRLGTPFLFGATNTQGLVRAQNFRLNQLENSDAIEAEALDEFVTGMAGCFGCQVHCRAKYVIPTGPYAGTYGEGPEYTHQCAFSAEPGCNDPITILEGTHLSNIYGIDCLEAGSMIAWAMELYENGIIDDKDTGGIELRFGNKDAVIEMMHQMTYRKGLGDILAEGPLRAAKKIGKGSEKYLVQVKGMSNLNSDERATPSLALNIATASRGSDHLRSRPAIDLYHLPEKVLRQIYSQPVKYDGPLTSDFREYAGKAWQVFWHEQTYMGVDSVGICKYHTTFLSATSPNWEEWSKVIYLNTGLQMSPMDLWNAADRANNLERMFNLREGMTRKDDWLVDRYFDEPTPLGTPNIRGRTIDREKLKTAIDEFYGHHGWDENGVPKPETLKRLGIDKEPSHLL